MRSNPKCIRALSTFKNYDEKKDGRICFQLFCLFNRFCDTQKNPMRITDEPCRFLFRKIGLPSSDTVCYYFPFRLFLECIYKRKDALVGIAVDNAYDEYVRDILVEKRILFRKRTYCSVTRKAKIGK